MTNKLLLSLIKQCSSLHENQEGHNPTKFDQLHTGIL